MKCKDVMLTLVFRCHETDTALDCARLMAEERIGFVPVLDDHGQLAGVITDRDLAIRLVAANLPADTTSLKTLMSVGGMLTCGPDDDIAELERRMAVAKKGRAVVIENGLVVGVISLSDIAMVEPSRRRTGWLLREVAGRESGIVRS
jgi:CBS domain-containing protein